MTDQERIDHWEKVCDSVVAHYKKLTVACDAALEAGAMDANGPLFEAIWKSFHGMLDFMDVDGWIDWFINENRCGEDAGEAGYDGDMKPISTTHDLAELIVKAESREMI